MRSEEGLMLLAEDGSVLWANMAAAVLLGYSPSEIDQLALPLGGGLENGLREPVGPVTTAFRSLLTGETCEATGDSRFPSKDDRRIAVHWKLWLLPPLRKAHTVAFPLLTAARMSAIIRRQIILARIHSPIRFPTATAAATRQR